MANGWAGLSLTCFATSDEAARMTCAGTSGCIGISGAPYEGVGGSLVYPIATASGSLAIAVQQCQRLDTTFFDSLLPVAVISAVTILLARRVWRMFDSHA